jgi:hypothetical protein
LEALLRHLILVLPLGKGGSRLGRLKAPILGQICYPRFEPVFFYLPRKVPILMRNTEILALQAVQKAVKNTRNLLIRQ